jgi:ABC-type dipeptide/oligopeptide/nickel transport system permease subunit
MIAYIACKHMRVASHLAILQGIAISVVTLGINLLGGGLRKAYDPRLTARDT